MNPHLLDPWSDAALIAARVAPATSRLTIVIGAEAWCSRCRTLRPHFDALAMQSNDADHVWLWLDLDDHAEFMQDFIPENLPLLISYRGSALTHALACQAVDEPTLIDAVQAAGRIDCPGVPAIRERLITADWAT
jgi:hypothetical protein